MSNSQGWISLHRKILDNPLFKDPKALTLWVYILLRANHQSTKIIIGNKTIPINRGQFLTGRKSLAEATGINESKIERLLKLFESELQIEQQKKSKYRLISITKYDEYQDIEQQTNNKRTTTEQQLNTDNNGNKVNNDNKERKNFSPPSVSDVSNHFLDKGLTLQESKLEAEKFFNHYESNGWKVGKNKMSKWKNAATGWLNRRGEYEKNRPNTNEQDSIDWDSTDWGHDIIPQ
jgi:hypothetical protein